MTGSIGYAGGDKEVVDLPDAHRRPRRRMLVLSPHLCPASVVDLPRVRRGRVREMLEFRLRALYPGKGEEVAFGYLRLGSRRYLLYSMGARVREEMLRRYPGRRLVPSALLAVLALRRGRREVRLSLPDAAVTARRDQRGDVSVEVAVPEGAAADPHVSSAALVRGIRASEALRYDPFAAPRPASLALRVLAPLTLIALSGWYALGRAVGQDARSLRSLEEAESEWQATGARLAAAEGQVQALEAEIVRLHALRISSPYSLLSVLAASSPDGTTLREFTAGRGSFEIRGTTADAWLLARRLASCFGIEEASLVEAAPDGAGAERFTIRGVYGLY